MANLLERLISDAAGRLVLLPPPGAEIPAHFSQVTLSPHRHEQLVHELQALRGLVYLRDGALTRRELRGGRHITPEDQKSWHIVVRDAEGKADGCIWYLEHDAMADDTVDRLRVRFSPLASHDVWSNPLRAAVRAEVAQARREAIAYAEVGGWAVSERGRCSPEGLLLILTTFGLSRVLGGALGLATATVRHSSAAILRRLGLSPLHVGKTIIPAYFDPLYNCDMELLRFDTRRSSARYDAAIDMLAEALGQVAVIAPDLRSDRLSPEVAA